MEITITKTYTFQLQVASDADCNRFGKPLGSIEIIDSDSDRYAWANSAAEAVEMVLGLANDELWAGTVQIHQRGA